MLKRCPFVGPRLSTVTAIVSLCAAMYSPIVAQDVAQPPVAQPPVAQPPSVDDQATDPPARVGRLTALDGTVSFRPAADTEWGEAQSNRPVTTGDRIWSDASGRAEVEIGDAAIRLWHETEVDVVRLDDHSIQVAVPQGSATLRLSGFGTGDVVEIDGPNSAVTADATGEYRIDVSPDGQTTTVKVWSGSAQVTAAGSSFALEAHQEATIHGDSTTTPTYDVNELTSTDDFDQWSTDRDERANRAVANRRYVPGNMPGTEDLDDNGDWDYDNDNGPVWYPAHVDADWVPYRFGHWVWFGVWGWTWVDDAQWGWAPFHYGRWAYVHNRWGWCPGRVMAPAVFAPALVVFVGGPSWSPGAGVGAGGGYGWFPLGPGEVYRPPYVVSTPYVRRVNITTVTNVTNITNITNVTNVTNITYRNRGVSNAVTVVPRTVFENASPVGHAVVRVDQAQIERAPVLARGSLIVPTRASVVMRASDRPIVAPPATVRERPVVALHAPPPAPPPLAAQLRTVSQNGGRPATVQQLSQLRATAPAPHALVRPVQSAARPGPHNATLTTARPGLPPVQPAIQHTNVVHPMALPPAQPVRSVTPTSAPTPTPPATPPPTRPAVAVRTPVGPPAPVPHTAARVASPPLAASYADQRAAQEARHVQEFAKPKTGETPSALSARQESEDQALEQRYHQAAASGRTVVPAPKAPAVRAPAPKAPSPPPRTATPPRPATTKKR